MLNDAVVIEAEAVEFFGPEGPTLNDLVDSALHMRRLIASVHWPVNGPLVKWYQFSPEL